MKKDYLFFTSAKNKMNISVFGSENLKKAPCIIMVHGFKGFKDWGFWPYTAEYFAQKGYFIMTFNFSHNGIGDNPLEFTELEKFALNTYSLEVQELREVIQAYRDGFFGETLNGQIGLIGHSRGGAVSLLSAYENASISALALWASVSRLDRFSTRQKNDWKKTGKFAVKNSRTKQLFQMNLGFLEDIEANINGTLNLKNAAEKLNKPLLIAHGQQDLSVPIAEADELFHWTDIKKTELLQLENTGHTFGIVHPFEGSNEKFDTLLESTEAFFAKHLSDK